MSEERKKPEAALWAAAVLVVGLFGYVAGMRILFQTMGVVVAAFCIWIGVRLVNRRERWAKRTTVSLSVSFPVLYVLNIGPAAKLAQSTGEYWLMLPYCPIAWLVEASETIGSIVFFYCALWGVTYD